MRLLALDQASRTSGWAVFNDGKLVTSGKFTADHSDVGDRLHFIRSKVNSLINEYDIDEVVFEDIQLQGNVANNVQTFKALAEVFAKKCPHCQGNGYIMEDIKFASATSEGEYRAKAAKIKSL